MKNHFFTGYCGNKRKEVEYIYEQINFKNIDTIVEPFCGSCALSYYIWTQNRTKDYKYILNDLDNELIELLQGVKDGRYEEINEEVNKMRLEILKYKDDMVKAKEIYLTYVKQKNIYSYLFKNRYCSMRPGLFPLRDFNRYFNDKTFNISLYPIFEFLTTANIEIYNINGNEIIEKYNNANSFIFLDPPYIASCNQFYTNDSNDNTGNIYEFLYHYKLKNFKSKILICHENNWLFKILFKDYLKNEKEYEKKYQTCSKKRTTKHICVKNYKL